LKTLQNFFQISDVASFTFVAAASNQLRLHTLSYKGIYTPQRK